MHVAGGRSFLTVLNLECYLLTLGQALEAASNNGGVVDKDILATVLPGDKAETLGFVKPLYCSCNHGSTSYINGFINQQRFSRRMIAGETAEITEGTTELTTGITLLHANYTGKRGSKPPESLIRNPTEVVSHARSV